MSNKKSTKRKQAIKELLIGVAVAIVGIIVSMASYNMAKEGERYTIYTGVIVLGAVYAIKGLFGLAFPNGFKKERQNDAPASASTEEEDPAKPIEA